MKNLGIWTLGIGCILEKFIQKAFLPKNWQKSSGWQKSRLYKSVRICINSILYKGFYTKAFIQSPSIGSSHEAIIGGLYIGALCREYYEMHL